MINVVIADDVVIIRRGLKLILEQDNEINVVGTAENAIQAHELCQNTPADIVLMDIAMPVCDGVEGTRLIKEFNPSIKVLILTTFYDDEKIVNALSNGADGYILKDIEPEELISTVKSTVKGLKIIHANILYKVVKHLKKTHESNSTERLNQEYKLTSTEAEIIHLIIQGKSNKEIAPIVHLTEGTVGNIISDMLSRFILKNRAQLGAFALKNKLV